MRTKQEILKELETLPLLPDGNRKVSIGFLNKLKEEVVFVFGDNNDRKGLGGQAAVARKVKNAYGFVTKKKPTHTPKDYYKPNEYSIKFESELKKLKKEVEEKEDKWFLIPTLGNGLANKFNIWEKIIKYKIKEELINYPNVIFFFHYLDKFSKKLIKSLTPIPVAKVGFNPLGLLLKAGPAISI